VAEFEFGGMTFRGGKMMIILTALSTAGGAVWAGFEFYNDYRNMKEVVENIDVGAIASENEKLILKMDEQMVRIEEAIEYTRDIKNDLRDEITNLDENVRRVEKLLRENENTTREIVQNAEERFENKRDSLSNDYDLKANGLRDRTDKKIEDLETRLNQKLQRALDNPLAN